MKIDVSMESLIGLGISEALASNLVEKIAGVSGPGDASDYWNNLTREVLDPSVPFVVHEFLYEQLSQQWDSETNGPLPAWTPSVARQQASNLKAFMERTGQDDYDGLYDWSISSKADFWHAVVETLNIPFDHPMTSVLDTSDGVSQPQWLLEGTLNIAKACFLADPEQDAVVFQRGEEAALERLSYAQLDRMSNRVASGLKAAGFKAGDAIAIDMMMTVESIIIYLGIVKAGCQVISIADSFTPTEIATRLRIGNAAGIFTMDVIPRGSKRLPMYEKVCEAGAPRAIVVPCDETPCLPLRDGDMAWNDFLSDEMDFETVSCNPHDTINILFSSGTTGDPKAIPWNHTTPIKAAADGYFHQDIQTGDVVCWPTNLGWMMGPWLIFASLINKGTIALYEQAPTGEGFCKFVQDSGVTMLGLVPSLVKAWRASGAAEAYNWQNIRAFSSTGECSAPADMLYLMSRAGYEPVIEYCGGTEIGGGYMTSSVVQPNIPSCFSTPALGTGLILLDEENQPTDSGEVFLLPPAMGLSIRLLNKDHHEQYFQGVPKGPNGEVLRKHGDQIVRLPGGAYRAQGRADDTMNLGGVKVGSAEIERTLKGLAGLDETAAVAINPPDGGPSQLVIFATVTGSHDKTALMKSMQQAIRTHLNPLFKIQDLVILDTLPRTASGKVMRRLLRKDYQC